MSDGTIPNHETEEKSALPVVPDFDEFIKKHRRMSGAAREYMQPCCGVVPIFAQGPTPEADCARFDRVFRPWPKWVLRLGAELWHVDFPTIDREVFYETFRAINAGFFRLETDCKRQIETATRRSILDRVDFQVVPLIAAAFIGHAVEHYAATRKKLDEKLAKQEINPEQHKKELVMYSQENLDATFREILGHWLKTDSVKPFEITETVENARQKTFDKHGLPKESSLIPIYRLMLHNWITIENMSGPKELTHSLLAGKGNADFYAEYDRVKKMCSRLGVKFIKGVKDN